MRECNSRVVPSRVKGRAAILRSLRLLLIRAARFSQYRASTPVDQAWAAVAVDSLTALVVVLDSEAGVAGDVTNNRAVSQTTRTPDGGTAQQDE